MTPSIGDAAAYAGPVADETTKGASKAMSAESGIIVHHMKLNRRRIASSY